MEFNMVCVKFDQEIKKPKFWTFEVFLGFLKKPRFFRSHFPALTDLVVV